MGRCNRLPCLRNRFLPKSVHSVLGVMGVSDTVPVDLEEFDVRYGWILEIRIDRKGGTKVSPFLVQSLLNRILSIAHLYGFLRSLEIKKESSSGGRGG